MIEVLIGVVIILGFTAFCYGVGWLVNFGGPEVDRYAKLGNGFQVTIVGGLLIAFLGVLAYLLGLIALDLFKNITLSI